MMTPLDLLESLGERRQYKWPRHDQAAESSPNAETETMTTQPGSSPLPGDLPAAVDVTSFEIETPASIFETL